MEMILIPVATVINFIVLRWKLNRGRIADAITDLFFLLVLNAMFAGTYIGMAIAMISGSMISIYLIFHPPVISFSKKFLIWCAVTTLTATLIGVATYILF